MNIACYKLILLNKHLHKSTSPPRTLILAKTRMKQEKDISLINIKYAGLIKVMEEGIMVLMVKLKSPEKYHISRYVCNKLGHIIENHHRGFIMATFFSIPYTTLYCWQWIRFGNCLHLQLHCTFFFHECYNSIIFYMFYI